jgi:polysaccharide pyruvyl transferase CsaB
LVVVGGDQELGGARDIPAEPSRFDHGVSRGGNVLLCGYYGEHNLGDDALLEVLLSQLPAGWEPLVTAHDQAMVQRRFGVATTDRRSLAGVLRALYGCDALVLGGGSLLQDSTSFKSLLYYAALIGAARLQGKPVGLWGQGLGPLRRRRSRQLVQHLLPLAGAISWRDPDSATLAAGWGIEAPVGSDPVWGLTPRPWQGKGGPIVLCWRPVAQLQGEDWRPYLEALDQLAARADRPVFWLPFHQEQDRGLLQALNAEGLVPHRLMERSRELAVEDPATALDQFAGASLVLAMRLHGLILAALAGAPCAALSYDPKVAAAATAIGCPLQVLGEAVGPSLATSWDATLDQPPLAERLASLRHASQVHGRVLERLLPPRSGASVSLG